MNRFEIVTPADLPSAVRLLAHPGHMALAGGVDRSTCSSSSSSRPARWSI
jgi:CO/xanthine dehydrogenase FAD-binding subunit